MHVLSRCPTSATCPSCTAIPIAPPAKFSFKSGAGLLGVCPVLVHHRLSAKMVRRFAMFLPKEVSKSVMELIRYSDFGTQPQAMQDKRNVLYV